MSQNVTILGHWNSRKAMSPPSLSWGEERTKILLLACCYQEVRYSPVEQRSLWILTLSRPTGFREGPSRGHPPRSARDAALLDAGLPRCRVEGPSPSDREHPEDPRQKVLHPERYAEDG